MTEAADDVKMCDDAIAAHSPSDMERPSGSKGRNTWACLAPQDDRFVDDLTGLALPPDLCRAARQKEIAYFRVVLVI